MNPYLAKLHALERHPAAGRQRGFEGFEGAQSNPIFESESVCVTGTPVGEPDSGNPHIRFDSKSASFENLQNVQNPSKYRQAASELLNHALEALDGRCPNCVDHDRWRQGVEDGRCFLAIWGAQALALGWTARDLFGLHTVTENPHPSYRRLSRYDETGLIWLLQGREVIALTADTATIRGPSSSVTIYRKSNKPGFGPLGDSLDDFQ
jgi:hypothetical protein